MALANITSRNLRVLIGADEQDWSASVGPFQPSGASLDDSGLLPITATLDILNTLDAPESIDPADNPTRWAPGTPVRIQVPNAAGTWVDHPQGRLFLLEEPDLPEDGGGITLQLGCRLAWHNTFEYDDDQTGITVGTPTNCATVAQNLLLANEIPVGNLSLGTWPYALAIPEGKGPGGSFVEQAGAIAYSNDWRYLWQQPNGIITATALDLSVAAPLITITLGSNDLLYRRVKVEATPPDELKVAARGTVLSAADNPSVEVNEVIGDLGQFSQGTTTCVGIGPIARSTTTTSWDATSHTTQTVEEGISGALNKTPGTTIGGSICALVEWKRTTVVKQYALDGQLTSTTTTEEQRGFSICPTLGRRGSFNWYTLRETVETPTVSAEEVLEQIVVSESVALVTLDPNASGSPASLTDPARMVDVSQKLTKWTQIGATTWRKSEAALIPKAYTDTTPDTSITASVGTTNVSTSSSGQNQPPKVEFRDPGLIETEEEYTYTATYTPPGGSSGRTRKALRTLPHGFSNAQCQTMAGLHLSLMAGRHRAALIEFPITDALLSAPPLFPCDVVLPSGEIRHYRVDGLSWEHTQDQAKAVGTGILVGTTPAP